MIDSKKSKPIIRNGARSISFETRQLKNQSEKIKEISEIYRKVLFFFGDDDEAMRNTSLKFKKDQINLLAKAIIDFEETQNIINDHTILHKLNEAKSMWENAISGF